MNKRCNITIKAVGNGWIVTEASDSNNFTYVKDTLVFNKMGTTVCDKDTMLEFLFLHFGDSDD